MGQPAYPQVILQYSTYWCGAAGAQSTYLHYFASCSGWFPIDRKLALMCFEICQSAQAHLHYCSTRHCYHTVGGFNQALPCTWHCTWRWLPPHNVSSSPVSRTSMSAT